MNKKHKNYFSEQNGEFCVESPTGQHEADYSSVIRIPVMHDPTETDEVTQQDDKSVIMDIYCKHCGCSGSFILDDTLEIDW